MTERQRRLVAIEEFSTAWDEFQRTLQAQGCAVCWDALPTGLAEFVLGWLAPIVESEAGADHAVYLLRSNLGWRQEISNGVVQMVDLDPRGHGVYDSPADAEARLGQGE